MQTQVKEDNSTLSRKDFASDREVKWCPGCGDYVILATLQKALASINRPKEEIVCVSGIGCSSRLPYYLDTYGIHSIHGRAAAVATGVKLANPDLSVWVITGDGDCMAIGGNHFIHAARRNVDLNIIIFNNKIYGMTKGQSSPTTPLGMKTKTAPEGSYERPFNIGEVALGAGVSFFARVPDNNPQLLEEVMVQAHEHKGTSVIEVLQNCVIFTDGIHEQITGQDTKEDNQLVLETGKPMIFGKEQKFGIRADKMKLVKVPLEENGQHQPDILVHDPREENVELQLALARMKLPNFPVAMGIIRQAEEQSTFDREVHDAIARNRESSPYGTLRDLFHSGNTWEID